MQKNQKNIYFFLLNYKSKYQLLKNHSKEKLLIKKLQIIHNSVFKLRSYLAKAHNISKIIDF